MHHDITNWLFHIVAIFKVEFCLGMTELYNNENCGNDEDDDHDGDNCDDDDDIEHVHLTL